MVQVAVSINPYHPPRASSERPQPVERTKSSLTHWCTVLLMLVIVGALVAEHVSHTWIVIAGPVLFASGLLLAFVSLRNREPAGILLGSSALALCVLVVFLINYYQWGPPQGDGPITKIAYVYVAVTIPYGLIVVSRQQSTRGRGDE